METNHDIPTILRPQPDKREKVIPTMNNKQIENWLNEVLEYQLREDQEEQHRYWQKITKDDPNATAVPTK